MHTALNQINLDYLKLMADGDQDMELTMLEMLLEELPSEFELMETHIAAGNWLELTRVSHKMKSTLAFIGNEEMTTANLTIEKLTKNGNTPLEEEVEVIGKMVRQFGETLPGVLSELQQAAANY